MAVVRIEARSGVAEGMGWHLRSRVWTGLELVEEGSASFSGARLRDVAPVADRNWSSQCRRGGATVRSTRGLPPGSSSFPPGRGLFKTALLAYCPRQYMGLRKRRVCILERPELPVTL